MPTNDDTVIPSEETLKANKLALKKQEKEAKIAEQKKLNAKNVKLKLTQRSLHVPVVLTKI